MLAGAAVFLLGGYYFMVDAMRYGEVAVVSPFRYSVILWAIMVGVVIWGEWPDGLAFSVPRSSRSRGCTRSCASAR